MTGMAVSAEQLPPPVVPDSAMWLPAQALNCYVGDAALRDWLLTPGLLTERIREAAGADFRMRLLREERVAGMHWREIDMGCGAVPWMFAHTRIPPATLAAHPWLGRIGDRPLGEALVGREALVREPCRYTQCYPDVWLAQRALAHASLAAQPLWVRHSAFRIAGAPFDLHEVFLPAIGRR
jgi:chorismate--pyruvate lyase